MLKNQGELHQQNLALQSDANEELTQQFENFK